MSLDLSKKSLRGRLQLLSDEERERLPSPTQPSLQAGRKRKPRSPIVVESSEEDSDDAALPTTEDTADPPPAPIAVINPLQYPNANGMILDWARRIHEDPDDEVEEEDVRDIPMVSDDIHELDPELESDNTSDSDSQDFEALSEGDSEPRIPIDLEDLEGSFPPAPSAQVSYDDQSTPLEHRARPLDLTKLALQLGLWLENKGIGRTGYLSLLKILQGMKDVAEIAKLPATLDAIQDGIHRALPLITMRKKEIPLDGSKLLTGASLKHNLEFFDPKALFSTLANSTESRAQCHYGMATFVNNSIELYNLSA
ncbi:hypothetical protein DM02DRAFT_664661 [Periconia macrospinosa]|uniref:Uncharacterized protein n=1 Tax=Periconia macrospinosa TaxID=97972 RepID=A0A2V1CYJ2_9PLEO|nr:hypothetical protein DM02DRAFT_664661 [Periconia macrospinosa]